jgi:hypothetical protein
MASVTLDKVWEDVKALSPDEQRQLREQLDGLLESPPLRSAEEELQRRLLAAGLLSEIKPPITDFTPYQNRKPIEVKGKPVSETIIEERR